MMHSQKKQVSVAPEQEYVADDLAYHGDPEIKNAQMTQAFMQAERTGLEKTSEIRDVETKIRQATGMDVSDTRYVVRSGLARDHKLAVAEDGQTVAFAMSSGACQPQLIGHELLHIVQQRLGKKDSGKPLISAAQAEAEVDDLLPGLLASSGIETLHPTSEVRLYQKKDEDIPGDKDKNVPKAEPKLGTGVCAVFYLETDLVEDEGNPGINFVNQNIASENKTFKDVAWRYVKVRSNRCVGINDEGKVEMNAITKYKDGASMIESLSRIGAWLQEHQMGKIAEFYVFGHGTGHGLVGASPVDWRGLYSDCNEIRNQYDNVSDKCRDVKDIAGIAPDVFSPNVNIVLHACNVSAKPDNASASFGTALYKSMTEAFEKKSVSVYGHNNSTKAGYNCGWRLHRKDAETGISASSNLQDKSKGTKMPHQLQLGSHETCTSGSPIIGGKKRDE